MSLPQVLDRHLRDLFGSGRVNSVLGAIPTRGPLGMAQLARTPEEVERFTLSPLACPNLLVHLTSKEARLDPTRFPLAVLARGCETRMLNQIFSEHGLRRDQVYVVGLAHCPGAIDPRRLSAQLPVLRGFPEATIEGEEVVIREESGELARLARTELVLERCRHCQNHEPLIDDYRFDLVEEADWIEPVSVDEDPGVEAIDAMIPIERWAYWRSQLERCIRCHACRDACPLCYCENCILERHTPCWVKRSVNLPENTAYQLLRVMHLVGRCTACGECERACPVDLPLGLMMRKMENLVREYYGHRSGLDPSGEHLLSIFDPRDTTATARLEQ
ncbi:MAG: 4Fe-4S dicluster domain-containing protein [Gammaproteobacteria bacterium]|nr:4Fe-4S dicluster domain-containing protein [Gammaproteobacteria bacterium]